MPSAFAILNSEVNGTKLWPMDSLETVETCLSFLSFLNARYLVGLTFGEGKSLPFSKSNRLSK